MEKIISLFSVLSILLSYLLGFSFPSACYPAEVAGKDKLTGLNALYAGQGITADEDYYYTSGCAFHQKSGIGIQFIAKWDADGFKKTAVNYTPIPAVNKIKYGSGHIGGISCAENKLYCAVEGKDYSKNFIYVYDTKDLSLKRIYDVSCNYLDDGIPWVAVDGENGYVYTSRWGETDKLLRLNLSDMSLSGYVQLSERISRIQGGEFYNGKLYLSKDIPNNTEETVYICDVNTGNISRYFTFTMTSHDNESEDLTVFPREDGSLFHVLNYDKLIGINVVHLSVEEY